MKKIGIITIHRIHNYGSVLQAYALQQVCEDLGYQTEIIDYLFPNNFQSDNKYQTAGDTQPNEPKWIKILFGLSLMRQHKGIDSFVANHLHLSQTSYSSPDALMDHPPHYDVYMTGSDQVWSPRHTNGDPAFMLHFAPEDKPKIAFAASIGAGQIPNELQQRYSELLCRYQSLSVREASGKKIIKELTGKEAQVVLDPTLLLNKDEWNKIATVKRQVRKPYILCYFLNYSFNAFPYVDDLATDIQRQTGYEIVRVARPPHNLNLCGSTYRIGATPEDFLALVRDAELVLTTSFHGTAFAVNYGRPVFTVVKGRESGDSRQMNLMKSLGLEDKVLTISDAFPDVACSHYDFTRKQRLLEELRKESILFLTKSLRNE
jgi:hypothetical protein